MTDQSSLIRTDSPLARERHVVQFYESEDALCAAAAKSVARRARMGQAILLLASGAHRAMIVEELRPTVSTRIGANSWTRENSWRHARLEAPSTKTACGRTCTES